MASILESGRLARILAGPLNRVVFYAITLHKRTAGTDTQGAPLATFTDYAATGCDLGVSAARRFLEAMPDAKSVIMLPQYEALATPKTGDEITCRGTRYHILAVEADPANATWQCIVSGV